MATITVYGADWCEDTRRSLRHLRRLAVPHRYLNIDEDLDALDSALALNEGQRRTPTIDLGLSGSALVEPDNDMLTGALIEMHMLTQEEAVERLGVQNVGDVERVARTVAGAALLAGATTVPRALRAPLYLLGGFATLTGLAGWCPIYHAYGVTSLGGPGDRPDETLRETWLTRREHYSAPPPREATETTT
jgi:glutaredoxin